MHIYPLPACPTQDITFPSLSPLSGNFWFLTSDSTQKILFLPKAIYDLEDSYFMCTVFMPQL